MYWTGDPLEDFHRHDRAQDRALSRLPKCRRCREPIQEEFCYEADGEYFCEECMEELSYEKEEITRVYTDDVKGE